LGAAEMRQWHKGPRPETAATTEKQGKCRGPATDHSATGQASSRVFRQDSKYESQDIVEEPGTAQAKEVTTRSLRARVVGAPASLENPLT
jgi:hypothetical protein